MRITLKRQRWTSPQEDSDPAEVIQTVGADSCFRLATACTHAAFQPGKGPVDMALMRRRREPGVHVGGLPCPLFMPSQINDLQVTPGVGQSACSMSPTQALSSQV